MRFEDLLDLLEVVLLDELKDGVVDERWGEVFGVGVRWLLGG